MTATTAELPHQPAAPDSEAGVALPLRGDTLLGVCEAIGQDLGFNANFLRVPLAAMILFDPTIAIGSYLALGVVVAVSRLLFPAPRPAASAPAAPAQQVETVAEEERLAA